MIATSGTDGGVKLWEYPPLAPLMLGSAEATLSALALDARNELAVTAAEDGAFAIWDIAKQAVLRDFHGPDFPYSRLFWIRDSDILLAGSRSGIVSAFRLTDGNLIARLAGHKGPVTALGVAPDGKSFFSADEQGAIRLWRLPLYAPGKVAQFDAPDERIRRSG